MRFKEKTLLLNMILAKLEGSPLRQTKPWLNLATHVKFSHIIAQHGEFPKCVFNDYVFFDDIAL